MKEKINFVVQELMLYSTTDMISMPIVVKLNGEKSTECRFFV